MGTKKLNKSKARKLTPRKLTLKDLAPARRAGQVKGGAKHAGEIHIES